MNTETAFISALLVHGVAPVFSVSEQGMTYRSEVRSYLMRAPRQQFNFNEAHIFVFREHAVLCLYLLCAFRFAGRDLDEILLFILCQPAVQDAFFSFNVPWTTQR